MNQANNTLFASEVISQTKPQPHFTAQQLERACQHSVVILAGGPFNGKVLPLRQFTKLLNPIDRWDDATIQPALAGGYVLEWEVTIAQMTIPANKFPESGKLPEYAGEVKRQSADYVFHCALPGGVLVYAHTATRCEACDAVLKLARDAHSLPLCAGCYADLQSRKEAEDGNTN